MNAESIDGNVSSEPHVTSRSTSDQEAIVEDDICAICQLLLCRPVTTSCNHTLCESCMATWADVSISTQMEIVDVDDETTAFDAVTGLEARCPMCRTKTSAVINEERLAGLRTKYPSTYAEREIEEGESTVDTVNGEVQTLVLHIGNRHVLKGLPGEDGNIHEWTFFVRPSRVDIIEEVHIHLHPTFRPRTVIRTRSPYEVRRTEWGYFTIVASVILKAGYSWMSDDAEDSPDGAERGMLGLEWPLDFARFDGRGSMGRLRLKVKNQRDWRDVNDEIEKKEERTRAMLIRQYESGEYTRKSTESPRQKSLLSFYSDGIYVPEEE